MKKFIIFCSTAAIPFMLVWIAFILTGFSFNPRDIFQGGGFWIISCVYWFFWMYFNPDIIEVINKINKT